MVFYLEFGIWKPLLYFIFFYFLLYILVFLVKIMVASIFRRVG